MKIDDALRNVSKLFLDTSPAIYYIQANTKYIDRVQIIFDRLDAGDFQAITSPVTLAEALILPFHTNQSLLLQSFRNLIVHGTNTTLVAINQSIAEQAAELRVRYNLQLMDAFQVGVALDTACDAFLTNDATLRRVTEIKVIMIDDLEL
ncbi:MAG: type II toxin-antitoxin system VapC family toxin [Chloroflexia bacterium]